MKDLINEMTDGSIFVVNTTPQEYYGFYIRDKDQFFIPYDDISFYINEETKDCLEIIGYKYIDKKYSIYIFVKDMSEIPKRLFNKHDFMVVIQYNEKFN